MRGGTSRGIYGQAKIICKTELSFRTYSKPVRAKKDPRQTQGGNTDSNNIFDMHSFYICMKIMFLPSGKLFFSPTFQLDGITLL